MPIIVNVDVMLARRKMRLNTLAELVRITPQNLSVLKAGRARAIRFRTLERLCEALDCQPGDLVAFEKGLDGAEEELTDVEVVPSEKERPVQSKGLRSRQGT
jgi:putative transcriptional regulator